MINKRQKAILVILIILTSILLTIIGFVVLPDTLIMQISFSGDNGTIMPKAIGLLIPFVISTLLSVLYYKIDNKKYIIGSVVGLVAFVLIFIFNL